MKKIFTPLLVMMVIILVCSPSFATITYNSNHIFNQLYGDPMYQANPNWTIRSPFRTTSSSVNNYVRVISKYNQPRNTNGTNPHIGTDLEGSAGTAIYPIISGYVITIRPEQNNDQTAYVIIGTDLNADGYYELYTKYIHIKNITVTATGQYISSLSKLAEVDDYTVYSPTHLHFEFSSYADMSIKNYPTPMYYTVQAWNYGKDLVLFSMDRRSSNKFYITGYIKDETSSSPQALQSVEVYYKSTSNTTWQVKNMKPSGVANEYYFDFKVDCGVPTGQTITFYIAGIRNVSVEMKWGLFPCYYQVPPKIPADFASNGMTPQTVSYVVQ